MKPECSWMWASSQKKPFTGWKMFPVRAGRSHFSWSNFQMQDTEDEMNASGCLSVCVYFSMCMPLLYHVCSQAQSMSISLMKEVKRLGFPRVDIMIGPLLLPPWPLQRFYFFWPQKKKIAKSHVYFDAALVRLILFINPELFHSLSSRSIFTLQAKLKKNIMYFYSATQQVKGGYAAALFPTLTLLLSPIETVCQSNHAPSQTSPRVEC